MTSRFGRGLTLAAAACLAFAVSASAAEEKKKTEKKPPSECAGLDNPACTSKAQCSWYKEITMKNGKKRKAHCQKKPQRTATKPA
jgi:hypothetical protein